MGLKEMTRDELLEKARRDYGVGVEFKSEFSDYGLIRTVKPYYDKDTEVSWEWRVYDNVYQIGSDNGLSCKGGGCANPVIYKDGKWAEIVSKPEVKEEPKVKKDYKVDWWKDLKKGDYVVTLISWGDAKKNEIHIFEETTTYSGSNYIHILKNHNHNVINFRKATPKETAMYKEAGKPVDVTTYKMKEKEVDSWCVEVTTENRERIKKWHSDAYNGELYSSGASYGVDLGGNKRAENPEVNYKNCFSVLLTTQQFYEKIGYKEEKKSSKIDVDGIMEESQEAVCKWCEDNIIEGSANSAMYQCEGSHCEKACEGYKEEQGGELKAYTGKFKVGDGVFLRKLVNGCGGVEGQVGVVVDSKTKSTCGLIDDWTLKVRISDGKVWAVDGDIELVSSKVETVIADGTGNVVLGSKGSLSLDWMKENNIYPYEPDIQKGSVLDRLVEFDGEDEGDEEFVIPVTIEEE